MQYELGGSIESLSPPAPTLALARDVLATVPGEWLYARVDVVLTEENSC